jgi:hypothetical protein
MNTNQQPNAVWSKLTRLAATAPPESADMPFGFATRVVAQWREQPREASFAMLEWLTVRGLAIAALILLGSAVIGYEAIAGVVTGETSMAGGLIESLLTL